MPSEKVRVEIDGIEYEQCDARYDGFCHECKKAAVCITLDGLIPKAVD